MTDKWRFYFCRVNGSVASIYLNLGLRTEAPLASKTCLLWVWVYFQRPRPDGLSSSEEAPILFKIEDALDLEIAKRCDAISCGRITTEGRREFYFYGETSLALPEAIKAALENFRSYKFDYGNKRDPEWDQYINVLYPSDENLERIANRDVLDSLEEQGDVHTVPREVQHWLYFPTDAARDLFHQAAAKAGFGVVSQFPSDGALPFGISIKRTQSVDQAQIDQTTIDLLHMARRFDGEYDGWESPAVQK
jgi:regulator of RNase E activity RraB